MTKLLPEIFLVFALIAVGATVRKLIFNRSWHAVNFSSVAKRSDTITAIASKAVTSVPHKKSAQSPRNQLLKEDFKVEKYSGPNALVRFAQPAVPREAILQSVGGAQFLDGKVIKLDGKILAQNFKKKRVFTFPVLNNENVIIKPEQMTVANDDTVTYTGYVVSQKPGSASGGLFYLIQARDLITGSLHSGQDRYVFHYGKYGQYLLQVDPKNNIAID